LNSLKRRKLEHHKEQKAEYEWVLFSSFYPLKNAYSRPSASSWPSVLQRKKPRPPPSKPRITRPPKRHLSCFCIHGLRPGQMGGGGGLMGCFACCLRCIIVTLNDSICVSCFSFCFPPFHHRLLAFIFPIFAYTTKYNMRYASMNLLLGYAWIRTKIAGVKLNVIPVVSIWKLSAHQNAFRLPRFLFCVRRFKKVLFGRPKRIKHPTV